MTAILVGIGVARNTPTRHRATADPLATPLRSVDTTTLTVRRAAFCNRVPTATAAAALRPSGSQATGHAQRLTTATWRPGQSMQVDAKVKDVVDEYGCSWTTTSGLQARAWVFSPPVTPARAAKLARQTPPGCQPIRASPAATPRGRHALAYGKPTSALTCGDSTQLRGLFGDAWLTCELPTQDLGLVGRWCLAVARAAG